MNRSDFFTVAVVVTIGVIVSVLLTNMLLGDPNSKSVTFKTVEEISADLVDPDPEVFNPDAINPTVEVYVGDCVDQDQNGELDEAELIACGRQDASSTQQEENATADTGNFSTTSNTEQGTTGGAALQEQE